MTTEHQSARQAAISALVHSADAIMHATEHALGQKVKWLHKAKLPGVVTGVEVAAHMYEMIGAARSGRWEEFGDHSLGVSSALVNLGTSGVLGLAEGLNDATVAVRRTMGDKGAGITIEEAEKAGLHAIQNEIEDMLFKAVYPNEVPQIRVGEGEVEAKPVGFAPVERLNPETLELIRNMLREAKGPELTFEPVVVTAADATTTARGRQDPGAVPKALFSLEVRTFQPCPGTTENPVADRPFDVAKGAGSEVRAVVTICPTTATAGKVMIQTSQALDRAARGLGTPAPAGPAATIEVKKGNDGSTYTLGISRPGAASGGNPGTDAQARLTISSTPGSITISGTFGCNASPAHQMVLRDTSGQAVFLAGHMPTKDGHAFHPGTKGVDRPSNVIRMTLGVDAAGRFDGRVTAEIKGAKGHVISRTEGGPDLPAKSHLVAWNHMVIKTLTPPQMPEPHPAQEMPQPARQKDVGHSPQTPGR
jgi:hypothetical protein